MPTVRYSMRVPEALERGQEILDSIVADIQHVRDNPNPYLSRMARVRRLSEIQQQLQNLSLDLKVPEWLQSERLEFPQFVSSRRRGPSRRDQLNNVSYILREILPFRYDERDGPDERTFFRSVRERIEEYEKIEFPSQYYKDEANDNTEA